MSKIYAGVRSVDKAESLAREFEEKITGTIAIDYNAPSTITEAAVTASDADIVVSNAGILEKATDSEKVFESFERELEINVYGLFLHSMRTKRFAEMPQETPFSAYTWLNRNNMAPMLASRA